jgi:hypothetical protein
MSACAKGYYSGVDMTRTLVTINRNIGSPLLLDLFELISDQTHSYDLPYHYNGQITYTDFDYQLFSQLFPLGDDQGYQHLWHVGQSNSIKDQVSAKVSWLMDHSYYSLTTAVGPETEIHFCRLGANDPNFNLRNEPAFIIRQRGKQQLFATVLEQHGYFNESLEQSEQARGSLLTIEKVHSDQNVDLIRIQDSANETLLVFHWKGEEPDSVHHTQVEGVVYQWQGYIDIQTDLTKKSS